MTNKEISFILKDSYIAKYGLGSTAKYTPVYMVNDAGTFFVRNIINDKSIDVDEIKAELIKTNGRYFTFCCGKRDVDPIGFIDWVKENDFNFEDCTAIGKYNTIEDGFVDFGGNLKEISCAFSFRIYDPELVKEVKELMSQYQNS